MSRWACWLCGSPCATNAARMVAILPWCMPWCSTLAGWAGIRRTGIPGRTLTCPGLVRPLLVEIKFRPGAKGPALSLGGEKLR